MLGSQLSDAIQREFFSWFHLVRYEVPRALSDGSTWHGFRPEGAAFRDRVTVNLETDREDRIVDAKLCLDRAFVEHPKDGAFARDIAAGFLRWTLTSEEQETIVGFLAELGDLGPNVIRFTGTPVASPDVPSSRLHRVYLGRDKDAEVALSGKTLRLINLQAREGPRDPRHDWIWIRVVLT